MSDDVRRALETERAAALERLAAVERDIARVVAATEGANTDDEHDPEGATIAFERAQAASLRERTLARLAEVDDALTRLATGAYGRCERCGQAIPPERLAARPSARVCVSCATRN